MTQPNWPTEKLPPTAPDDPEVRRRLDMLAWLLDNSIPIPGLRYRIGLDGLLGLIPGVGDAAGMILSSYIITEAARLGAPRSVLLRMSGNVLLESIVGLVPFAGDLFDFVWKANLRNVRLLQAYAAEPRRVRKTSWLFVTLLIVGLFAVVVLLLALAIFLAQALWRLIT